MHFKIPASGQAWAAWRPALMSFFELKTDERLAIGMSDGGTEGKAEQPNKVSLAC